VKQAIKNLVRRLAEQTLKVYLSSLPRREFRPEKIERIIVFAYHGLGNFIMYTPALKLLREQYPNARIDLQVGNNTGCEEVLAGAGLFDHIYNLPYAKGIRAWIARLKEIRETRYDITVNEFHSHSWQLALTLAFSGVPFRVGHVTSPGWAEQFSHYSFIFNLPVGMREDEHETRRYLDLVEAIGARAVEPSQVKPFMHLAAEDREFADTFINSQDRPGSIIGIQPGTSPTMRWKQWPIDRYRKLLERLTEEQREAPIILFGAANEAEMIRELAEGLSGKIIIAAGKTTIKQVAALIERCALLVCNDSGLMHVAVAVGTPVVAIYGPTDLRRTAPLGESHTVVRHDLPCSPCFKLEGDAAVKDCPHHDCLNSITADEVFYQLKSKVRRAQAIEMRVQ
jgi:lipopolysaccharide heptosyltransferase II